MKKLIINGINGKMGKNVAELAKNEFEVFGVDLNVGQTPNTSFDIFDFKADAVIDFSHHLAYQKLLQYSLETKTPLVICSTGFTQEELKEIELASKKVPIFLSFNMSLGINVMSYLVSKATKLLAEFDVEIVEKHHNQKIDAPSGTAMMLLNSVEKSKEIQPIFGREGRWDKRNKSEVGVHAVRGGTVIGEHEVGFYGEHERVVISHTAESREVFAKGAILAANFLIGKTPGLYNMNHIIKEKEDEKCANLRRLSEILD